MPINMSNIEHAVIAVALQLILFSLPFKRVLTIWSSGAIAIALFLGREIAQNEYWWAFHYNGWHYGEPLKIPWYAGLVSPHWRLDSLMDIACPMAGCLVIALCVQGWRGRKRRR